ncbi:MAG TPA: hypothetical protein VF735_11060 [Pyrinomonadaceae bacterium]
MRHLNRRVVSVLSFICSTATAVALTCLLPVILLEQDAQAQTQSQREAARIDLAERQRALRSLENVKQKLSRRPPEPHLAYQQIKEDFEQLQFASYHLSGSGAPTPVLDYGQIKKDAAEVRKRASRLKTNLILPEPDKDEKLQKSREAFNADELKPAIDALDALVKRFVWNPVFQHPNVLDVENSVKARRDLEAIIRLSEQIHKRAEIQIKEKRN